MAESIKLNFCESITAKPAIWQLRLYVAGQTPRSLASYANLRRICEQHLPGTYEIEVIDLVLHPEKAKADQIVALPSLVRHFPAPVKKIVGDLGNEERVLAALEIGSKSERHEWQNVVQGPILEKYLKTMEQ